MKRYAIAVCALCAMAAFADSAADAVMLKKRTVDPPVHSFLEDVLPVKKVKPAAKVEPAPAVPAAKVEAEAAKPAPAAEVKPAVPAAKPAEPVAPAVPAAKPAEPVAPAVSAAKPVEPVAKPAEPVAPAVPAAKVVEPVAEPVAPAVPAAEVKSEEPAAKPAAEVKVEKKADAAKEKVKAPARDAIITADRTDYDRKEGVVLFDRNVYVDDSQYQMHADRLFLFLDGTNELKRLVAIGHVAITNEDKRAYCARATFNKKLGRVVMYSSDEITAQLHEEGKKGSDVKGEKITFWLDSEQVEVENPVITMPGGIGGKDSMKKMLGK